MRKLLSSAALLLIQACTTEKPLDNPINDTLIPFPVEQPPSCSFGNLELNDSVVVLAAGGGEGKELDFVIEQKSGNAAKKIDVAVNSIDKPVVLMLGTYNPTIWNIGWTPGTKILAVSVFGYHKQRVSGLPAGTPVLVSSYDEGGPCELTALTNNKTGSNEDKQAQQLFNRPIAGFSRVARGKVTIGDPIAYGVSLVTSNANPLESFREPNTPLAGSAGLEQALKENILRKATLNDVAEWTRLLTQKYAQMHKKPPDIPPYLDNAFMVLKEFVCPAGLYGSHSANFYVAKGVPYPKGDCGHSSIYDFNSMMLECSAGSACGEDILNGRIGAGAMRRMTTINSGPSKPGD
ncbi:hypothetical protein ACH5Y9_13585 [Methylomonas sp. BW4-1]|uniref:hypothetical protein n=1 Tax=Methylomonas sp. BW4-1 TaxID=3376685 RepID=UPI0040412204